MVTQPFGLGVLFAVATLIVGGYWIACHLVPHWNNGSIPMRLVSSEHDQTLAFYPRDDEDKDFFEEVRSAYDAAFARYHRRQSNRQTPANEPAQTAGRRQLARVPTRS
ncbi:MAG: hypothetical protein ACR2I1_10150 [Propionibacteriaceae bacterium]